MIKFRDFMMLEALNISGFLERIESCKTAEGIKELEKYYTKRQKEVEIPDADDIQIRDAFRGKLAEFESGQEEPEEEEEPEKDEDI